MYAWEARGGAGEMKVRGRQGARGQVRGVGGGEGGRREEMRGQRAGRFSKCVSEIRCFRPSSYVEIGVKKRRTTTGPPRCSLPY